MPFRMRNWPLYLARTARDALSSSGREKSITSWIAIASICSPGTTVSNFFYLLAVESDAPHSN
jgi:hypothetical protein